MVMSSAQPLPSATKTLVGRVPYLNCAPFFDGLDVGESWEWLDLPPRYLGREAEAGRVLGGPMALADYVRLKNQYERLGSLGIAVRGRCGSTMLFARRPIRQLEGATIAVSEETSTTAMLLRPILEQRYRVTPAAYRRGDVKDADAVLLIGDEALRAETTHTRYPFEADMAFEWWTWQHLPCVFAVWAVRKDAAPEDKQRLSRLMQHQLAVNLGRLRAIADARAESAGIPASAIAQYLGQFHYRFGAEEERAIEQFERIVYAHDRH